MSLEQLSLKLRFPFIIRATGLLSIILSISLFFILPRFTGETVQEHYDQIIIEQIDIPQTQQIERPPPPARPSIPIESEDEDLADDLTIEETDLSDFEAWDAPPPPPPVLLVEDHLRGGRYDGAWLSRALEAAFSWYEVQLVSVPGGLADELGVTRWFDPKSGLGDPARRAKRFRRDLLTGTAHALRQLLGTQARLVAGIGQGAVITAAMGHPQVAELALASKCVSPTDALFVAQAWANVRASLLIAPWILKSVHSPAELKAACPEFFHKVPATAPS